MYTRSDIFAELARGMLDAMRRLYTACPHDPLADETPILPKYYAK